MAACTDSIETRINTIGQFSRIMLIALFLLLISCGGGDSGKNADDSDNKTPPPSKTTKTLRIEPNQAGDIPVSILGGGVEVTELDGNIEFPIPQQEHVLVVVGEDGNAIWLGMANRTSQSVELGAESTALSLLSVFPAIAPIYKKHPIETESIILADPTAQAFANVIRRTPSWDQMTDDAFMNSYAEAIGSILDKLTTVQANGTSAGGPTGPDTKLRSIARSADEKVTPFFVHTYPVGETPTKSGATLGVTGNYQTAKSDPRYALTVTNDIGRWVKVVVGADEKGGNEADNFIVASTSVIPFLSKSSVTRDYSSLEVTDDGIRVEVYGPSFNGKLPEGARLDHLVHASAYSLAFDFAVPTASLFLGTSQECLYEVFAVSSAGVGLLHDIAASDSLLKATTGTKADLGQAVLDVVDVMGNYLLSSAAECVASAGLKVAALYMVPILGQIKQARQILQISEYMILKSAPFFFALQNSQMREEWILNNTHDAGIMPVGFYPDGSVQGGSDHYSSLDAIPEAIRDNYFGDCVPGPNQQCGSIVFGIAPPYKIKLYVGCFEPGSSQKVACQKATFVANSGLSTQEVNAHEDGTVEITLSFEPGTEPMEYVGYVETLDVHGSMNRQYYQMQVFEAGPQLVLMDTVSYLPYHRASDNVISVTNKIDMECCEEGESSRLKMLQLVNIGPGSALIEGQPTLTGNDDFTLTPLSATIVPPGGALPLIIEHRPSSIRYEDAILSIKGSLGETNPDNPSFQAFSEIQARLRPRCWDAESLLPGKYIIRWYGSANYDFFLSQDTYYTVNENLKWETDRYYSYSDNSLHVHEKETGDVYYDCYSGLLKWPIRNFVISFILNPEDTSSMIGFINDDREYKRHSKPVLIRQ